MDLCKAEPLVSEGFIRCARRGRLRGSEQGEGAPMAQSAFKGPYVLPGRTVGCSLQPQKMKPIMQVRNDKGSSTVECKVWAGSPAASPEGQLGDSEGLGSTTRGTWPGQYRFCCLTWAETVSDGSHKRITASQSVTQFQLLF